MRWKWKHRSQISHHLLMLALQAILNMFNHLLEMLKLWSEASLMLIHAILNMLKPLLEIPKLRSEVSLILIHVIIHGVELCITDYSKLLHVPRELIWVDKCIHGAWSGARGAWGGGILVWGGSMNARPEEGLVNDCWVDGPIVQVDSEKVASNRTPFDCSGWMSSSDSLC